MLFYTILSAMAEWEISETSERIHASIATRRKMGKMAGGMASYGFKIVDAKLEVNQEEASVRKLMYELFLQYKRRKIVARELNIKGFRTRTGKQWSDTTVKRLLKNPDAKGMQIVNYWDYSNGVSKKKPKPREEWIINECPRIVSDELWDSVNAIILEQENANSQSNKPLNQRVNLFTSFLYCNEGHKMSVQSKTRKYSCTQCKLRIDKDDLEEIFHTRLTEFTISPEEIDQYTESSTDVIQGIENEIKASKKKIETLQIKMDKLIELSIDGEIPKKGFKTHYQPLFEQSEALQKHVNIQEGELQNIRRVKNSMGEIISSSHSIYDNWHSLSHPEKRSVIETITKNIIFDGDTIEFTFKQIAPPTYLKSNPNEQRNSATGFL
jgi:site-specific DNA recombinase